MHRPQRHRSRGVDFTSLNAGGLQTALFYNLDVKRDATASVTLGALQDNGIVTTAGVAAPTWKMGVGGDGFDVAHDGQNATDAYGRSNATIVRSTNDGNSYAHISPPWPASEAGVYLAAVATDPNTARRRVREQQTESLAKHDGRDDLAEEGSDPRARQCSERRADQQQQCRYRCRTAGSGFHRCARKLQPQRHHAQPARAIRRTRRLRSQRSSNHLRRARRA